MTKLENSIISCVFKGHDFKFSSGISDLHGQVITNEYECSRCGRRKVIENEMFKACTCEECSN